jgi:hypothetical protein
VKELFKDILLSKRFVKRLDSGEVGMCVELVRDVEGCADFDVFLREVMSMDEDFADLVSVSGILSVFGIVTPCKEAGVATLDGGDGVGLNFVCNAEDLPNLDV